MYTYICTCIYLHAYVVSGACGLPLAPGIVFLEQASLMLVLTLQAYCLKVKEMDDEEYEAAVGQSATV